MPPMKGPFAFLVTFSLPTAQPQPVAAKGDCYSSSQLRFGGKKPKAQNPKPPKNPPRTLCRARVELRCSHGGEERKTLLLQQFCSFCQDLEEKALRPAEISLILIFMAGTWIFTLSPAQVELGLKRADPAPLGSQGKGILQNTGYFFSPVFCIKFISKLWALA